jgi:hypothetical protein
MVEVEHVLFGNARKARERLLTHSVSKQLQERSVVAIVEAAASWRESRVSPQDEPGSFPSEMVWHSLDSLLASLTDDVLWQLIQRENVVGIDGPPVVGHIVASNTPLLAITSVVRALLIGSASIVKLPAQVGSNWLATFLSYLKKADPAIAALIEAHRWSSADVERNQELFLAVDSLIAYGNDDTIRTIQSEAKVPVVGYGHRVSAAVLLDGNGDLAIFDGFADDILMYDQTGCLSPHTLFVEGSYSDALYVASLLADAMHRSSLPRPHETLERLARIREFRALSQMDNCVNIVDDTDTRFTVVVHTEPTLHVSPTHACLYVVPITKVGIIEVISYFEWLIQGIAVGGATTDNRAFIGRDLSDAGASLVCGPGKLQKPPIDWRENKRDVLRTLIS